MNAIELLKTPFYISKLNMVIPLTKINFYFTNVVKFVSIMIHTVVLITNELLKLLISEAKTETIVYIMCILGVFMFFVLNDKLSEQTRDIESLKNQLNYLKKMERMRDEIDEIRIKDLKFNQEKTNQKLAEM
jgi:hypothetical protein